MSVPAREKVPGGLLGVPTTGFWAWEGHSDTVDTQGISLIHSY